MTSYPVLASVRLASAGVLTSRLAFGTSRLHYVGHRERQRLLAAAAAFGFIHFDTSPAYGDGLAETELGQFVAGQRDRFIIATKYGIPADPIAERWSSFVPTLRILGALARRIGLRHRLMPPLNAAGLRESAERSLRRLKTDRIDILLLHEPRLERLCRPDEILREFEKLRQSGLIRAFGLAGGWNSISPLIAAMPQMAQVVQTAESEWPATFSPDITYGAVAAGRQNYFATRIRSEAAVERVRSALKRRPSGVVIVSSTKIRNLRILAEAAI